MRIYAAQINSSVGHIAANIAKIENAYIEGVQAGASLVVVPEGAVTGYPAQDLILRPTFVKKSFQAVELFAKIVGKTAILINVPEPCPDDPKKTYNSAVLLQHGRIQHIFRKRHLWFCCPNVLG